MQEKQSKKRWRLWVVWELGWQLMPEIKEPGHLLGNWLPWGANQRVSMT
jgi:hypothetical protein